MADAQPGWYPDPWMEAPLRWWDGVQWSAYVYPTHSAYPNKAAGALTASEVASARHTESRMWRWALAAVAAYGAVVAVQLLGVYASVAPLRNVFHQIVHGIRTGTPVQTTLIGVNPHPQLTAVVDIGQLLLIGIAAVFLTWQYNAARVARSLGYPAKTSPALGVAAWFIPVINIWFPYWALRDLLPPGHALRPTALLAWMAHVGATLLAVAAFIASLFSSGAAVVPLVLALCSLAVAVTLGCRLVAAVREDHRQAVSGSPS